MLKLDGLSNKFVAAIYPFSFFQYFSLWPKGIKWKPKFLQKSNVGTISASGWVKFLLNPQKLLYGPGGWPGVDIMVDLPGGTVGTGGGLELDGGPYIGPTVGAVSWPFGAPDDEPASGPAGLVLMLHDV